MSQRPDDDIAGLRIVKHRHWGRWFSALIVLLLLSLVVTSMVKNPRFEWGVVAQNLTEESILAGVLMTIELTVISVVFGLSLIHI